MAIKLTNDQKQKLGAVGIGLGMVALLLYFFVIAPQKARLVEAREKAEKADQVASRMERSAKTAQTVATLLSERTEELRGLEERMASGNLYFWMVTNINQLRLRHPGVSLPKINPPTQGPLGMIPNYPYEAAVINASGTAYYKDFGRFLADLESEFPFLKVQNLDLSSVISSETEEEKSTDREKLKVSMDLIVLVKPSGK